MPYMRVPDDGVVSEHINHYTALADYYDQAARRIETETASIITHLRRWDAARASTYEQWAESLVARARGHSTTCRQVAASLRQAMSTLQTANEDGQRLLHANQPQ